MLIHDNYLCFYFLGMKNDTDNLRYRGDINFIAPPLLEIKYADARH